MAEHGSGLAAPGMLRRNPGARPRRRNQSGPAAARPGRTLQTATPGPRPTRRTRPSARKPPRPAPHPAQPRTGPGRAARAPPPGQRAPGPAAAAQVPSRRPAGNGRLRGGAAPHVRASRPERPGDRPLKGTGPRGRRPRDAPPPCGDGAPQPGSLWNPFIDSALLFLPAPQSAMVSRDPRPSVPLGPDTG